MSFQQMMTEMGRQAKEAAKALRIAGREQKDRALELIAQASVERKEEILRENLKDVEKAREAELSSAMIDRLTLSDAVIEGMVQGIKEVAALPEPGGEVTRMWKRPNGFVVGWMRIPLGVIGFIYESRPSVTVEAASLCLKSGNAVILKGGVRGPELQHGPCWYSGRGLGELRPPG